MTTSIDQDYKVYRQDGTYFVKGDVDGKILCRASNAYIDLQTAVDALQDDGGTVSLSRGVYTLEKTLCKAELWKIRRVKTTPL